MIVQLVMLATTMHNRKNWPSRSLVAWLPKTFQARYKPDRSYLYPKHDSIVQDGWCMPAHIVIVIRSSRSTLHGLIHLLNWTRTVNIIAFNLHNMYKVHPPKPHHCHKKYYLQPYFLLILWSRSLLWPSCSCGTPLFLMLKRNMYCVSLKLNFLPLNMWRTPHSSILYMFLNIDLWVISKLSCSRKHFTDSLLEVRVP